MNFQEKRNKAGFSKRCYLSWPPSHDPRKSLYFLKGAISQRKIYLEDSIFPRIRNLERRMLFCRIMSPFKISKKNWPVLEITRAPLFSLHFNYKGPLIWDLIFFYKRIFQRGQDHVFEKVLSPVRNCPWKPLRDSTSQQPSKNKFFPEIAPFRKTSLKWLKKSGKNFLLFQGKSQYLYFQNKILRRGSWFKSITDFCFENSFVCFCFKSASRT